MTIHYHIVIYMFTATLNLSTFTVIKTKFIKAAVNYDDYGIEVILQLFRFHISVYITDGLSNFNLNSSYKLQVVVQLLLLLLQVN